MRQISPYPLYIGNAGDSRDIRRLLTLEIAAIVDLALEELPLTPPRDLVYCRYPLVDGAGNPPWLLRAAIDLTSDLLKVNATTFLFCGAGLSRSPAIAAAALVVTAGFEPDGALSVVGKTGPHDVSPGLWKEICSVLTDGNDPR